ncbi:hypothetical protein MKX08_002421 [Trichoderma sp. CBMAI-0020]|nr:hypothetical protein MKX08_002421 [Trichoderma sp. CBMAI-0020]
MHLMYTLDASGNRLYTLKKVAHGQVTKSAHPARFSPDDKWSRQRVTLKRRFTLLLTQQNITKTRSTGFARKNTWAVTKGEVGTARQETASRDVSKSDEELSD